MAKLHLAVDENHQLLACELTTLDTGDPTAIQDLLAQTDTLFDTFIIDGAYDGEPFSQAILNQQPDAQVMIPPHKTPARSTADDNQRDSHIKVIDQHGHIA
ncbi:transposase, partial [Nitrosomonas supralitoralis]|uniref:transposase n=1 Tax=Nitrosomonas supralitoralis TaxID=2116706 RepID=UPI00155888E6